jgi:hypothetical protein
VRFTTQLTSPPKERTVTPESIPGLTIPKDLVLWTPLERLELTEQELIDDLLYGTGGESERRAA